MSIFSRQIKHADKIGRSPYDVKANGQIHMSVDLQLEESLRHDQIVRQSKRHHTIDAADTPTTERKSTHIQWRSRNESFDPGLESLQGVPRMNIAILVVGSRGDVQPFIAFGKVLQNPPYSHRVRICTHPVFKDFVEDNGFEFFSIGGDPEKLMSFMVRNPSVIPSLNSIRAGDVSARRADIAEMLQGSWRACTEAGDGITPVVNPKTALSARDLIVSMPLPFVADAIISNPPAYAHIHIAERLAIPLHMVFTMPWSPTSAFSHPLANVKIQGANPNFANLFSFRKMEMIAWEGLHDLINNFRERTLNLDPVHPAWGHTLLPSLKVPFTYCWSPALIPKPTDWGSHISISGFFFLPAQSSFKPDPKLLEFLDAGPPPVYIGFGSIVVDDPDKLTSMVLRAVKTAGVRALVSKGWGNLGGEDIPDNMFLLGNVPHDWLFPRCSAVVHHGGAGTTAIGIALGLPTVVVPFFGDQPWWGNMVHRAGAGPEPVPYKSLTADSLAENIKDALKPERLRRAYELSQRIKDENGSATAAELFQSTPQMQGNRCFVCPDRVAVWRIRRTNIKLSCLAATVLLMSGNIQPDVLKLVRNKEWHVEQGAQDPIIGMFAAVSTTAVSFINDFGQFSSDISSHSPSTLERQAIETEMSCSQGKRNRAKASARLAASLGKHTVHIPVALMYNLVNGFHNAPKHIFHDPTVRVRPPITGLGSGLMAGSKELGFGLYDAVTGIVTHPVREYRSSREKGIGAGALGLIKGVGRGAGGFAFKVGAAAFGIPGYGLKGLERELENLFVSQCETNERDLMSTLLEANESNTISPNEATAASAVLWNRAAGNDVGTKIRQRRIWQGVQELLILSKDPTGSLELKQGIIDNWRLLKVGQEFTMA